MPHILLHWQKDPYEPAALANLGVLDVSSGHLAEGMGLLERLVQADPSQTPAGLNLAFIQCKIGRRTEALSLLERLQAVNPDDPQLRMFLDHGSYSGQRCEVSAAK